MKTAYHILIILLIAFRANSQSLLVPYSNNFDAAGDDLGWTHYAFYGNDDWELGTPMKANFSSANSVPNAWVTKLTGFATSNSQSALETPFFDLSDLSTNYCLSFSHKRHNTLNNNTYKLEYSLNGSTWSLLNPSTTYKSNWQTAAGFPTPNLSFFDYSSIRLTSIQGQDSVKFRFIFTGGTNAQEGWMIDNFSITEEFINLQASQGDTIRDISRYFSNITVKSNLNRISPYENLMAFTTSFYISDDSLQDVGDILLGNVAVNTNSSLLNWSNTFPLPPNLSSGIHYIVYLFDSGNAVAEQNETDNSSFAVLIIDSIYQADYFDDLEGLPTKWNKPRLYNATTWEIGDAETWHIEQPISGNNALIANIDVSNNTISDKIESPYLDLSSSTNTSMCFWYRQSTEHNQPLTINLPVIGANNTFPAFLGSHINVQGTRKYGWDCFCASLSAYDGEIATRFRIESNTNGPLLVDDIYIGTAKPDAAIVDLTSERFTTSSESTMTLVYDLFNAGLDSLPSTNTELYWSTDSIVDASDVLLTTITEPALNDTTFLERTISFIKPTTASGNYFLIYKLDATGIVSEIQENNNIGWIKLFQNQSVTLPYTNNFSASPLDWSHGSILGVDEWVWDSGETMKAESISSNSHSQLYSPVFDLSELTHPVIEFDFDGYYSSGELTLLYSTNGGKSWEQLEHSSVVSQKRMYTPTIFASISGLDLPGFVFPCSHLLGLDFKQLISTGTYSGRDYDDGARFVYDLQFLQGQQVQFMFDHANIQNLLPLTIDNFSITEAQTDLYVPTNKKLLATSADAKINTFFFVKNNANYMSMPAILEFYCSVDSIYDAADVLVQTQQLDTILPYQKRLVQVYTNTPASYGNYNYLLYKIQQQGGNELNTQNNSGNFPLAMDTASEYTYPMVMNFNATDIDGWSWRSDSSANYSSHRFRHLTVIGEPTPAVQNGQWFLDPIDQLNYYNSVSDYSINHLESPAYDFSNVGQINLMFDFLCVGIPFGNNTQGGNISYSIDGGNNWIVLSHAQDPNATNWYDSPSLSTLNNEPGWGDYDQWSTAVFNLSFLGGQPNVRFRFNYKAEFTPYAGAIQGFRMDNFVIVANPNDLVAQNLPDITTSSSAEYFDLSYNLSNVSTVSMTGTITGIYWSTDNILDATDELLYQFPESTINPGNYNNQIAVYFPHPVTQPVYYLFYKGDLENSINEANEQNNVGRVKIIFNPFTSEFIDLEAVIPVNEIQDDLNDQFFPFTFQYINNGTIYSEPSLVKFYWSDDATLDVADVVLYTIEEPVLNGGIFNTHSGNIYYPLPITQQDYYMFIEADADESNIESIESNNLKMVHVLFDLTNMGVVEVQQNEIVLINSEESLIFSFQETYTGNFEYSLYSASGQLISSGNMLVDSDKLELKKPYLSAGVYFMKAMIGNKLINLQFIEQ